MLGRSEFICVSTTTRRASSRRRRRRFVLRLRAPHDTALPFCKHTHDESNRAAQTNIKSHAQRRTETQKARHKASYLQKAKVSNQHICTCIFGDQTLSRVASRKSQLWRPSPDRAPDIALGKMHDIAMYFCATVSGARRATPNE